jgi:hypothetical protein
VRGAVARNHHKRGGGVQVEAVTNTDLQSYTVMYEVCSSRRCRTTAYRVPRNNNSLSTFRNVIAKHLDSACPAYYMVGDHEQRHAHSEMSHGQQGQGRNYVGEATAMWSLQAYLSSRASTDVLRRYGLRLRLDHPDRDRFLKMSASLGLQRHGRWKW